MSDEIGGGTWGVLGAGAAAAITGILSWFAGRSRRAADDAGNRAETDIIDKLREEVARLSARVTALEASENRLRNRVWDLEAHIRRAGIEPPPEATA